MIHRGSGRRGGVSNSYGEHVRRPNVLFITLDQFRGDTLSCAGHPVVQTPHLDALAADGLRLSRHYSQAAPCAPGRAALYTGMYQMNNRVVANGTPLDDRFDNVARAARRAGYAPALFGYTDQGIDPRIVAHDDPRLSTYEGVLPGFDMIVDLAHEHDPWREWLGTLGYRVGSMVEMLMTEGDRPAEHSESSFLTNGFLDWHAKRDTDDAWFAHLSYLRPHPPFAAAGEFGRMYDPAACGSPIPVPDQPEPYLGGLLTNPAAAAPAAAKMARWRAQYYGMVSEVDAQIGRLAAYLRSTGEWDDTLIVVTADHGEQLGDHGLVGKVGYFESSYHIVGVVRHPYERGGAGTTVTAFTENVDLMPTICEAMGIDAPAQCDGRSLGDFLRGDVPDDWRTAAHYEFDWRNLFISAESERHAWDRRLARQSLVVQRGHDRAYVQFANGRALGFDLAADPTWHTPVTDPTLLLADAQELLAWRAQHGDRTLTDFLLRDGGLGRR